MAALAAARGVAPEALALDHMLSNEGRGMLYLPFLNYADGYARPPRYDMLLPSRHDARGSRTAARTWA